jgi:hypothetical protein
LNSDPKHNDETAAASAAPKRRYEKPAIIWRNAIDTRSLSIGCAKSDPGNGVCLTGGLQS